MLGFDSESDAKEAYISHYSSNDFFGSITVLSYDEFIKDISRDSDEKLSWKNKNKYKN